MAETQYFKSSLLAQQMEDTWVGTVRFNAEQGLTETQKAQARENIGAVPFGSNLKILGHFNTVAELQASAPQNVGDAYSVGASVPYKLYIFDGLTESWLDYGYIHSQDINARFVQNVAIAKSAWSQDTTALPGYSYKARITLADSTTDSFPIVVFESEQAFSGNFAPMSFAFTGYLEVFAKSIPTKDINIVTATVIVGGGAGKGITNASATITDGSVTQANLSVSARCGLVISATGWTSTGSVKTWTLNAELSATISNGFAVAFTELWPNDKTRISISGVRLMHRGEGQLLGKSQSAVLGLVERCNMIALQKMSTDATNGDVWLITGDVEVIS